ncbi:MAG: zf-HC2 domain-containing protein [Armatimonadota bacterium]|nr:zf-HC2 domain-containing protein [Armatimonadota bacterium]
MNCSRQNEEQIADLAAGGLSGADARRLRRHLAGCAECQARWEQTQQLWTGLRSMASAPVSDSLQSRVRGQWPRPLSLKKATNPMKRRMALLTCTLLLVGITAAMAARVITYHPSGGFGAAGQMWNYTTNLKGRMTVLDLQGRKIGQFTNDGAFQVDAAGPKTAWVKLSVEGEHFVVDGPGRHEIKDGPGRLLGYVILSDVSEAEHLKEMGWTREPRDFAEAMQWAEERDPAANGGTNGVTASVTGVRGFDKTHGVSWKMRGYGTVKATQPNGDMVAEGSTKPLPPEMAALLPPGFAPDADSQPEFTLIVHGKTVRETGYGKHILQDNDGKPLLILDATPLSAK